MNEKSFSVETRQTGAGLSKMRCVSHLLWGLGVLSSCGLWSGLWSYFPCLPVWCSVFPLSLCNLSKQNWSLVKLVKERWTSPTWGTWSDSIVPIVFLQGCSGSRWDVLVMYEPFPKWFCDRQNKPRWRVAETSTSFKAFFSCLWQLSCVNREHPC